ncbi:type IV pilus biogenesis/stability protein PilW [Colwellia sp. E2M01]|nr:type IV pilus biogenesis/stability protein PilW [Colwellia sp. E2M01]
MAKYITSTLLTVVSISVLTGCVTQSFENNEPIIKTQANRDEMAATRISLGLGYLKMGDMPQAKLNLEKAKAFSPKLVQVYTAFAHYYETVGEVTLAKKSFEEALVLDADSADTLNNYGVFLCRQGQVEEAEVQFLKAIAVPSYLMVSQSYENLSSCYLQNDDFVKAELYLTKAIYHDPNRIAILLQMIRLQYAMGNYTEAKRFLLKFERNTQRYTPDSLSLAYKLYIKLGQRRTANNYANMLVKMYPQSWEAKQYLLNELMVISADELAKRYQLTNKHENKVVTSDNNKRVVKLSPNKGTNTPYTNSITTSDNGAAIANKRVATSSSVNAAPSAVATTTQTTATAGAAVISATAGAAVATTALSSDAESAKPIAVSQPTAPQAQVVTAKANKVAPVTQTVTTTSVSNIEPTSTQPIPATRDVALPEETSAVVAVDTEQAARKRLAEQEKAAQAALDKEILANHINNIDEPVTVSESATESTDMVAVEAAQHTVESGDNLYKISVKYNIKLDTFRQWNNLSESNQIQVGDKLYIVDPKTVNNINE